MSHNDFSENGFPQATRGNPLDVRVILFDHAIKQVFLRALPKSSAVDATLIFPQCHSQEIRESIQKEIRKIFGPSFEEEIRRVVSLMSASYNDKENTIFVIGLSSSLKVIAEEKLDKLGDLYKISIKSVCDGHFQIPSLITKAMRNFVHYK